MNTKGLSTNNPINSRENNMRATDPVMVILLLLAFSIPLITDGTEGIDLQSRAKMTVDDLDIIGNMTYSNISIIVNGNITVGENSTLILDNGEIQFNGAGNGTHGILVRKNGSIFITNNSLINTGYQTGELFFFKSYGNVTMDDCKIENVFGWVRPYVDGKGGIEIHQAFLSMSNSTISDCRSNGLYLNGSNANIFNSTFLSCGDDAIESINASINISSSIFRDNNFGIYGKQTDLRIDSSKLYGKDYEKSFGIKILTGSVNASNLVIDDFGRYGMAMDFAEVFVKDSLLRNNGHDTFSKGIYQNGCNSTLINVRSVKHANSGLYANNSNLNIIDCHIEENRFFPGGRGIKFVDSKVLIRDTTVKNCSNFGIVGYDSEVMIQDNLIRDIDGTLEDFNLFLENCSGIASNNMILGYDEVGAGLINCNMIFNQNRIEGEFYFPESVVWDYGLYIQDSNVTLFGNEVYQSYDSIVGVNSEIDVFDTRIENCFKGIVLQNGSRGTIDNFTSRDTDFFGIGIYESHFDIHNADCDSILIRGSNTKITDSIFREISGLNHAKPMIFNCSFEVISFNTNCNISIMNPVNYDFQNYVKRYSTLTMNRSLSGILYYKDYSRAKGITVTLISKGGDLRFDLVTDNNGYFEIPDLPVLFYDAYGYSDDNRTYEFYPYFIEAHSGEEWFTGYLGDPSIDEIIIRMDDVMIEGAIRNITIIESHPEDFLRIEKGKMMTFSVIPYGHGIENSETLWYVDGILKDNENSFYYDLDTTYLELGYHTIECRIVLGNTTLKEEWEIEVYPKELDYYDPNKDLDRDALPDIWEYFHFGHLDYDGEDDPDQDGYDNYAEFFLDTDPMEYETYEEKEEKRENESLTLIVIAIVFGLMVISLLGIFIYLMTRMNIKEKEEILKRHEEE